MPLETIHGQVDAILTAIHLSLGFSPWSFKNYSKFQKIANISTKISQRQRIHRQS